MTSETPKLRAKQAGYLRMLGPAQGRSTPVSGPMKAQARKLHKAGLATPNDSNLTDFRRTDLGEQALAAFDADVARKNGDQLRMLKNGDESSLRHAGMNTMLDAGIVEIPETENGLERPRLTAAGERVLDMVEQNTASPRP